MKGIIKQWSSKADDIATYTDEVENDDEEVVTLLGKRRRESIPDWNIRSTGKHIPLTVEDDKSYDDKRIDKRRRCILCKESTRTKCSRCNVFCCNKAKNKNKCFEVLHRQKKFTEEITQSQPSFL